MNRRTLQRRGDLLLVLGWALVTTIVALTTSATAARVVLGLAFVLILPGYAVLAALFPRRAGLEGMERISFGLGLTVRVRPLQGMEAMERVAFSLCLSLGVVAFTGLANSYLPWGLHLPSFVLSLDLVLTVLVALAAVRRQHAGEDAFTLELAPLAARWRATPPLGRALALLCLPALLGLVVSMTVSANAPVKQQHFTQFYLLGANGVAAGYPHQIAAGTRVTLLAGIINNEGRSEHYQVALQINGQASGSMAPVALANGATWTGPVHFTITRPGDGQAVEFLLLRRGDRTPYRALHLTLNVTAARP